MKSGKVLLGVLAGVAAGALMGILLAPQKGSKTRKQLLRKGGDYAGALQDKFDELADIINKKYESNKEGAEELVSKIKRKFEEVKKEVNNVKG